MMIFLGNREIFNLHLKGCDIKKGENKFPHMF